ncbi:MAG: hypothetical protein KAR06_10540 [Deltaproteobacteria bacterium]|nr:hypothetical protein [Deltaproteobacteria bacterium]
MKLRKAVVLLIAIFFVSCASPVAYKVSKDFEAISPVTVALIIIEENEDSREAIPFTLDVMEAALRGKGYNVVSRNRTFEAGAIGEYNADAVVFATITKWRKFNMPLYSSFKVAMEFEMVSSEGQRIWRASFDQKASQISRDKEVRRVLTTEIYEPLISRIVSNAFYSLPVATGAVGVTEGDEKRYFDWLP